MLRISRGIEISKSNPQCQDTGSIRFTRNPENGPEEVQFGRSGSAGNKTGGAGNRSWDHQLFLTDSWLSIAEARQRGVGIAVTRRLAGSIIEQVAVSEQLAYVKFAAQRRANLVVIVCYAPTNEADDLAKDNFWNQLSSLVSSFKQRERVCLVGDFNAEPGQKSDVNMLCRGPFGMGEENDNSEKLLFFCVSHDLLIGRTWFRHQLVHGIHLTLLTNSCERSF